MYCSDSGTGTALEVTDITLCRSFDRAVSIFSNVFVECIMDPVIGKRSEEGGYSAHSSCIQRDIVRITVHKRYPMRISDDHDDISGKQHGLSIRIVTHVVPMEHASSGEMAAGSNDVDAGDWRDRIA
jgi:hypothetical protein